MTVSRSRCRKIMLLHRKINQILEKLRRNDELEESICIIIDSTFRKSSAEYKLRTYAILYLRYHDSCELLLN